MDTLIEIYETLKRYGYCADQQDFSLRWLGRSRSYFAHLITSGRSCSVSSLGLLSYRLKEIMAETVAPVGSLKSRRLSRAWVHATTMFEGEWEIKYRHPRDRITAVVFPDFMGVEDR